MEAKEDSEEISSDGEFEDAKKIEIYPEDASEVLKIEEIKAWQEQTGLHIQPPDDVIDDVMRKMPEGTKHNRFKGNKYFNMVGYQGECMKSIPRWATDDKLLVKVMAY